jgi:dienelactone hydrolase
VVRVLEAARAGMKVQGVVSFHGGLGRDAARVNNVIKWVLVLHGADDLYVPAEAEVSSKNRDTKADWEMIY